MEEFFQIIADYVRQPEYFVPRDYQSMGGMWTVDRYTRDNISYRIFDEGYGSEIFTEELRVRCTCTGNKTEFTIIFGELGMLEAMANFVKQQVENQR
jgi:hypothetical protein